MIGVIEVSLVSRLGDQAIWAQFNQIFPYFKAPCDGSTEETLEQGLHLKPQKVEPRHPTKKSTM
jgi:hypothetical protein